MVIGSEQKPSVPENSNVVFENLPSEVPLCFIKHPSKLSRSVALELIFTTSFILGPELFIPMLTVAMKSATVIIVSFRTVFAGLAVSLTTTLKLITFPLVRFIVMFWLNSATVVAKD